MTQRVSVIIPTWNRRELLAECLKSLGEQTFAHFETIVVDDGSMDGTAEFVTAEFRNVKLVALPENRGFCAAVNAGIRHAKGEFIVLLNNDMTLDGDFLANLVKAAGAGDAAMFAPLVLWRDQPDVIYGAGDRQWANGRPESIGFRCPLAAFTFPQAIFGVSAGAALYRREVFERIGLFDERFVAYFEDSDLNFRARLAGFRAECVRDAVAYHVGSASIEGRTWWRARQCCRNHVLLVLKNMPWTLIVRHAPKIMTERWHQVCRAFSAARAEFGAVRAAGILLGTFGSLLQALPHALAERRKIQRSRAIGIQELDALLTKETNR